MCCLHVTIHLLLYCTCSYSLLLFLFPFHSLREFAEAYKVVKNERNKAYSQIQTCQQLSAEMKEKMKVLQNELEILQNAVDSKSK